MSAITLLPIGTIHSPYRSIEEMPIQPIGDGSAQGTVVLEAAYADGLEDIEGFSHLILIYQFHRVRGFDLKVKPFLDDQTHGLFATRAPRRPNPIGLSVVPLLSREGNVLLVDKLDVLDGTPLLDIKPFVPDFDSPMVTSIGWLTGKMRRAKQMRSDDRFAACD
ncbi:MAG: tRNA (N6-threonylcarbamoyladenosine(37)-N6)-methyltransferase TrmO [Desulfobacterales bacterium]|nr:tRNA (N6-threonylcarbamoyladenosine(37)-N6)-methyltransferase TrmO [Desulfobacterales bacterium]